MPRLWVVAKYTETGDIIELLSGGSLFTHDEAESLANSFTDYYRTKGYPYYAEHVHLQTYAE